MSDLPPESNNPAPTPTRVFSTPASRQSRLASSQVASDTTAMQAYSKELVEAMQMLSSEITRSMGGVRATAETADTSSKAALDKAMSILDKVSTAHDQTMRDQREINAKIVDVAVLMNQVAAGKVAPEAAINVDPGSIPADLLNQTRMIQSQVGGIAKIGPDVNSAIEQLTQGHLAQGLAGVHASIAKLSQDAEHWTKQEIRAMDQLTTLAGNFRDLAIEGAQALGGPQKVSIMQRAGQSLGRGLFGEDMVQGATEQLLGMIPGMGGPLGGVLREVGGAILGKVPASYLLGGAGVAAAGTMAYRQMVDFEQTRRDYRNIAGEMGGGEALHLDMRARAMSINPWMDNAQAQKIIQGGLRSGYTGGALDDAISMATETWSRWGIEAETSMKLYHTVVTEAGGTAGDLTTALDNLAETAVKTDKSMVDLVEQFTRSTSDLQGAGAGKAAAPVAQFLTSTLARVTGVDVPDAGNMINSPTFRMFLGGQLGINPLEVPAWMHQNQNDPSAIASRIFPVLGDVLRARGLSEGMSYEQLLTMANIAIAPALAELGVQGLNEADMAKLAQNVLGGGQYAKEQQRQIKKYAPSRTKPQGYGKAPSAGQYFSGGGEQNASDYLKAAESFYGIKTPILEEYFRENNNRDIAVKHDGKVLPLDDFMQSMDPREALDLLQSGKATVANIGEAHLQFGADGKLNRRELAKVDKDAGGFQSAANRIAFAYEASRKDVGVEITFTDEGKRWFKATTGGQNGNDIITSINEHNRKTGAANANDRPMPTGVRGHS